MLRTMQEIGLATKAMLVCGSRRIYWEDLYFAYALFNSEVPGRYLHALQFEPSQVVSLYSWASTAKGRTFLQLLVLSEARNTTDPRDRVFALLSHPSAWRHHPVTSQARLLIEPDYTKSFPTIYTDIAYIIIRDSKSLDVLSYIRGYELAFGLPTWAPLWSHPRDARCLLDSHIHFSASGSRKSSSLFWHHHTSLLSQQDEDHVESKDHTRILSVLSVAIDKVYAKTTIVGDANSLVMQCLPLMKNNPGLQYGRDVPEKFCEVLACGRFHPQYAHEAGKAQYFEDLAAYCGYVKWLESDKIGDWENPANVKSFNKAAWYACRGRSLFQTYDGHFGLGPAGMRVGDEACILRGAKVPFIVRKLKNGYWNVVGECYIPGFMDGDALSSLRAGIKVKMLV
jgi:hypothetical protein